MRYTDYGFEIFSSKPRTSWVKKNQFWGHTFPHISGSNGPIVFKKNRVHPCVDPHQPYEFRENSLKTVTCIVTVIIIVSWKSRSVTFNVNWRTSMWFCCSKVTYSKKILCRINHVLIKFSLNELRFEKSWNECKNPSFLHNVTCIESDHGLTKMRCCLSTFMAFVTF